MYVLTTSLLLPLFIISNAHRFLTGARCRLNLIALKYVKLACLLNAGRPSHASIDQYHMLGANKARRVGR